ncbi:MAG: TolC family protein [Scytonema sp. PMC 1069.18]|nr:TolC family protein [Scytonema sp. PMC 1069.18]MEC4879891.1 TolC family protein [Scytonema sp. PMC 1070.18]
MKAQKILHSFLPGVTAAVIITQPTLAGTVKITGARLFESPNILASTSDETSSAININTQSTTAVGNSLSTPILPAANVTAASLQSVSDGSVGVILAGKTGVPIRQVAGKVQGVLLSLKPTLQQAELINKIRSASSKQKQNHSASAGEESQNNISSSTTSKRSSVVQAHPNSSSPQPTVEKINSDVRSPKRSQTPSNPIVEVAQLLEQVEFCPQKEEKGKIPRSASLLARSSPCSPKNAPRKKVAQADPPTTTPVAPVTPGTGVTTPSGAVPVPDYLNPSPNPLQFPTQPEEVRIQGTQPITLGQALELARRNNRDLQEALITLERTQFTLREARAALYPTAGLTSNLTRSGPVGSSDTEQTPLQRQLGINNNQSSSTTFSAGARVQYDIYTGGQRSANIRAAEEQVRQQQLEIERQSEEIRLNVTTQYYDLQQQDENVRIAQSAVANAQASLRDAQALERAGVQTRFDVLRAQVNLANFQQQLTNSLASQRIARRQLAQTLSLSQSLDISAADPVKLAGLWNIPLERTIILAFQNRPELQQQLTQRNIAQQRIRAALAQIRPQVSFVGNYSLQNEFDDDQNAQDSYSVALQATWTLFDGGAAKARANQERANIRLAENQFANQRNQIRFQVEQAYAELQSNLENVQTATASVDQAREALRLARLRFQAGVGTQTEVIDAENDLVNAEGQRVQAILQYNRALAQLQRSITSRANL